MPASHDAREPAFFYGFSDTVFEIHLHEPDMSARDVPERLVQELWRTQRFDSTGLRTQAGETVVVLDPGRLNTDSGPDFTSARVRIGETDWAGSVEIHTSSGGWVEHKHHFDRRYNSVVLHVALHADIWTGALTRTDGTPLPEVILYPNLDRPLRQLLHAFYARPAPDLLCAGSWDRVPDDVRDPWIARLAKERLDERRSRLAGSTRDATELESLLHERVFTALGYAKNADAMALLARRIPLALARRVADPADVEALHFGVAGLLPTPGELLESNRASADYAMELRDRFERLNCRLDLLSMEPTSWRFFRLRPANFPPLRIAQAAALTAAGGLLHEDPISKLATATRSGHPTRALCALFDVALSPFWETHVRLERPTRKRNPGIGRQRIEALLVNAVLPVILVYAGIIDDEHLSATAYEVLSGLPAEPDEVLRRFAVLGTSPTDALSAQGLHQLYRTRCQEARCLNCAIGKYLLNMK